MPYKTISKLIILENKTKIEVISFEKDNILEIVQIPPIPPLYKESTNIKKWQEEKFAGFSEKSKKGSGSWWSKITNFGLFSKEKWWRARYLILQKKLAWTSNAKRLKIDHLVYIFP